MAQVTIELEGLDELVAQFQGLPEKYRQRSQGTIEAGLTNIEADAKTFAPKDTGRLADQIHKTRGRLEQDELGGAVVSDLDPPYDIFQEKGTRPHEIEASPGGVLAWEGVSGPAFAKRVQHPGTHPNPFMRPAADINFPRIRDDLIRDLESALANT